MAAPATDSAPRSRIKQADVLCAAGLAFNLMWCSLEGHAAGFAAADNVLSFMMNPRAFWLLGIGAMALVYLTLPHRLKLHESALRFVVPLCSAMATLVFALSPSQGGGLGIALATFGLLLSGVGHFWFSSRCYLLLARKRTFVAIAWVIAGAVLLKTILLPLVTEHLSESMQIAIACAIPVINAALLGCAERSLDTRTILNLPRRPLSETLSAVAQRNFVLLVVLSAFLLATVRRLSFWGLWGDTSEFPIAVIWALPEFLVVAFCLALYVYCAFMRTERLPVALRFQPAIIIVLTGLFIGSMSQSTGSPAFEKVISIVIHVDEAYAYLLFWSVIALSMDALSISSSRVLGIGGVVYAGSSFIWVAAAQNIADVSGAVVTLAAYAGVVALMLYTYRNSKLANEEKVAAQQLSAAHADSADSSASLNDTLGERCSILAERYHLTPRETEVFNLLAQGRTRAYIQEELVLSTSTVKTHVSHIYSKLGVHDRQGMMDLILEDEPNASSESGR